MKATNDGKNEGLFISKQVSFLQVGFSHNYRNLISKQRKLNYHIYNLYICDYQR